MNLKRTMHSLTSVCLALVLLSSGTGFARADTEAREAFIDDIISTAQEFYKAAGGRLHRASEAGDLYICKNFTTLVLFRKNADKYRMAEYPNVELDIPLFNKETDDGYLKGIVWEDLLASQGNPFYVAAQFRYDADLSLAENKEIAREFMMQVMRGDYFQMRAKYRWGNGAHSLVFIENYDPEFQTVRWTDSNMRGETRDGVRYGLVQFNVENSIDWFVDAFCQPQLGATLYRLRDDIVFAGAKE